MNDSYTTISEIKESIAEFVRQRGWGAGHNALNLAVSINLEASELLESSSGAIRPRRTGPRGRPTGSTLWRSWPT